MAIDVAEFEARYGFSPQEFVNLCAIGMLQAPGLAAARAELADARKAVAAFGDQDKINAGSDNRRIQDLADAVNLAAAKAEIIHAWAARADYAREFAEGEITWEHFRSYFGTFAQEIIDEDLANGEVVRDALVAALKA